MLERLPVRVPLQALAVALAGCRGPLPAIPASSNVLLVVMDTTRADHLGAYGYARSTTPNLDALAREGVLFENMISPTATTPPSLGSMLTGVLPFQHGVRAIESVEASTLDPKHPTLAEILGARGFATAAFVSSVTASSRYGFGRGFDVYSDTAAAEAEKGQITGREVNAALLPWLRGRAGAGRFFALAHYFDVHDLRVAAEQPFLGSFMTDGIRARDRRIALYDGELRYLDGELQRVFTTLDETGLRESTMVIVIADHGEGLGDHDHQEHGILYQEQIRVPLLLRGPGIGRGLRVKHRLTALNLAPTILDLAGVPAAAWPSAYVGHSLRPWLRGRGGAGDRFIVAEAHNKLLKKNEDRAAKGEVYAAIRGPWKYLYYPLGAPTELFNLDDDPAELRNRIKDEPQLAAELHQPLQSMGIMSARGARPPVADEQRMDQLRALGYVQ